MNRPWCAKTQVIVCVCVCFLWPLQVPSRIVPAHVDFLPSMDPKMCRLHVVGWPLGLDCLPCSFGCLCCCLSLLGEPLRSLSLSLFLPAGRTTDRSDCRPIGPCLLSPIATWRREGASQHVCVAKQHIDNQTRCSCVCVLSGAPRGLAAVVLATVVGHQDAHRRQRGRLGKLAARMLASESRKSVVASQRRLCWALCVCRQTCLEHLMALSRTERH